MSAPVKLSAVAQYPKWTKGELATLRLEWARGGSRTACAALSHRSRFSVLHKAARIGLTSVRGARPWTLADDEELRLLWSDGLTLKAVARRIKRTPIATQWRARRLGLTSAAPQGWETLQQAKERTGFDHGSLRRILAWAGVTLRPAMHLPADGSDMPRRQIVDPLQVDDAVAAWMKAETVSAAAARVGIPGNTLSRRLRQCGFKAPRYRAQWRVTDEMVRQALALSVYRGSVHKRGLAAMVGTTG